MDLTFTDNYENSVFLIEVPPQIVDKITNNQELILKGSDVTILCTSDKSYELKYLETTNTFILVNSPAEMHGEKKQISLMTNHTLECLEYNPKKYPIFNLLKHECNLNYDLSTGEDSFSSFKNKYSLTDLFSISELSSSVFAKIIEDFGIFEKNDCACVMDENFLYSFLDDILILLSKESVNYDKIPLDEIFSQKLININPVYDKIIPKFSQKEKYVVLKNIFDLFYEGGSMFCKINIDKVKLFCAKNIFFIKKESNFKLEDFLSLLKNMLVLILPYEIIDKITLEVLDYSQTSAEDNIFEGYREYDLRFLKGYSVIYFLKTQRDALIK
jgi:hypothetical protein